MILLIIVLLLCFGGWGYNYRSGGVPLGDPVMIILVVVVLLVLFGGVGPGLGIYRW